MSVLPVKENWFQPWPAGQGLLYFVSQYWMKILPVEPVFSNTNCCQPRQMAGFPAPLQTVLAKKSVLSWSVYAFATEGPELPIGPDSLVTPVTLSNEPKAVLMNPEGAWAAMSLPAPTTSGRG